MVLIHCQDLGFRHEGRTDCSLRRVNLRVGAGECALLAGRGGSGKSTLLHCLSGLIPDYYPGTAQGHIHVGPRLESWLDKPLADKAGAMGVVFQDPRHQFFAARVEEEVLLASRLEPTHRFTRLNEVLREMHIQSLRHRLLDTLSAGEQQRVAIAAAMFARPAILLLDEPSANLSMDAIVVLRDHLRLLKRQGVAIVIAEHRFSWLRGLVDQVVVLDDGRTVMQGDFSLLEDASLLARHGLRRLKPPLRDAGRDAMGGPTPCAPADAAVSLEALSFRHCRQAPWLWRGLGHSFPRGRVTALTGRNGSGKTTLLSILHGALKPVEGALLHASGRSRSALY